MNLNALILDGVLLLLAVLLIGSAYRKGFLCSVTLTLGFAASVVAAMMLSGPAARFVYDSFLEKPIVSAVEKTVNIESDAISFETAVPELLDRLPGVVSNSILAAYGGEENLVKTLEQGTDGVLGDLGTAIGDNIISPVAISLLEALMCLLIFSICVIIVKMIAGLLKSFDGLPVIGPINSLLGALLGAIQALVVCYFLALAASVVISLTADSLSWLNTKVIEQSYFFKIFYQLKLF